MARMMVCRTGEIGDRNVLMPSVMDTVTGEAERAREAVDSEGL